MQFQGVSNLYEEWSEFMAQAGFREVGRACEKEPYGESDGIWVREGAKKEATAVPR